MKPIDALKALGAGALLLALNLLLTTIVIFVYAAVIEPGRPQTFYSEQAVKIAVWTAPIGGALLMFAAGWIFAKRRPQRNGLAFAGAVWLAYGLIDGLSSVPMGGVVGLLSPIFAIHLAVSLAGGLAGAALAKR